MNTTVPQLIYEENIDVWNGERSVFFNKLEIVCNLMGINLDYVNTTKNIFFVAIILPIIFLGSVSIYFEVFAIYKQIQQGIVNWYHIIYWVGVSVGVLYFSLLLKTQLDGIHVILWMRTKNRKLVEFAQNGERIIGYVDKIVNYNTIIYYFIDDMGKKNYRKFQTKSPIHDRFRQMSRVAIMKYQNQEILL